ncbi:MAG: hypothetical protein ACOYOK_02385 [Pseudobdellovibrionaceae bacterium]|jgi:hypothetical protein
MSSTSAALFNTVSTKDIGRFFAKGGEVDPEKVVKFLKYKKEDVAVATDIPVTSVRYDERIPVDLKQRMVEWAMAINLVASYFNDLDRTMLWFQISNPLLGDMSPRDMIRIGRFKKLQKFIQTALAENKR